MESSAHAQPDAPPPGNGPDSSDGRHGASRRAGSRTVATGIEELDRRLGGLPAGGLYLISSPPGHARTAAVLQFVAAGLGGGGRVGLVTRSRPDRLLREAGEYGLPLRGAWADGRLTIIGFRGEYEMRLRRAGSPGEVFRELDSLLDPTPDRLVFDPGSPVWEGRGDGATAQAFVEYMERADVICLATTTTALDGDLSAATELVTQAATGLFELEETDKGLVRLRVLKLEPGGRGREEVTLSLSRGRGLTAPRETPARRRSDISEEARRRTLLLPLGSPLPEDLGSWLRTRHEVVEVDAPLNLIAHLQDDRPFGLVLLHLDREQLPMGLRACRVCRRLRPALPVIVVSGDAVRARDRAKLLRAGADECLTGRINVEEFASRMELLLSPGRSHPGPEEDEEEEEGDEGDEGSVPSGSGRPLGAEAFGTEVRRLLDAGGSNVFTLVRFRCDGDEERLEALARIVRTEEGDRVGPVAGESAVLLPHTRPPEAEVFVQRALEELDRTVGESPDVEILGGVRDETRLRTLLG